MYPFLQRDTHFIRVVNGSTWIVKKKFMVDVKRLDNVDEVRI